MKRSLRQIAEAVDARLQGDGTVEIEGVASIGSAAAGHLVFVGEEKFLAQAMDSRAGAVIAGEFAAAASGKPLLISRHPKLAFARAARFLQKADSKPASLHASAIVHASARLASGVIIEEQVVVAEDAEVGGGTRIAAGCVVGRGVRIGENCRLFPRVVIYEGTILGARVVVHAGAVLGSDGFGYVRDPETGCYEKFPQIGRLVIEDDVEIGSNTTIDRGALDETRIGRGTKIDNLVHIGHNCRIAENVVIAAQTGISGSVTIERDAVIGGQVGIGDHARLEEGVIVGSQGGILSNKILRGKGIVFWGTPVQPLKQYLKQLARLAKLDKQR